MQKVWLPYQIWSEKTDDSEVHFVDLCNSSSPGCKSIHFGRLIDMKISFTWFTTKLLVGLSVVAISLLTTYEVRADEKDDVKAALFQVIKESAAPVALQRNLQNVRNATAQQLLEARIIWAVFCNSDMAYFDQLLPQIEASVSKWNGMKQSLFFILLRCKQSYST